MKNGNERTVLGVNYHKGLDDGNLNARVVKPCLQTEIVSNGDSLLNRGVETAEIDMRYCEDAAVAQRTNVHCDKSLFAASESTQVNIKAYSRLGAARLVVSHLFQRDGLPGFYRGFLVSVMTYAPGSALWWFFYDSYCGMYQYPRSFLISQNS